MGKLLPPKFLVGITSVICLLVIQSVAAASDKLTPCDLEEILSELVYPEEGYELQAAALRSQLRNRMLKQTQENYQDLVEDDMNDEFLDAYEKRSVATLARDGALRNGKRNMAALARSGLLRGSSTDYIKRSIATLAKNGQLPSKEPETEDSHSGEDGWVDQKRSVASLARSGYVGFGKRNIQALARNYELGGKRSIAAMMRNGLLPQYDANPKRNVQSLARSNLIFPVYGKKNVGNLARDWLLPNTPKNHAEKRETKEAEKRNIGSWKNSPTHGIGSKQKREVSYSIMDEAQNPELAEPNYQTAPLDYEELAEALDDAYPVYFKSPEEKRYLGAVMRSGFRPFSSHKRYIGALARMGMLRPESGEAAWFRRPEKRHIGALARSGWMPSAFRPVRGGRFSRSGRARSHIAGFYPHTTDSTHHQPSWAFVDGASPATQTPYAGTHRGYLAQHGDQHRPELPLFTGESFDPKTFLPDPADFRLLELDLPKQDIMFDLDAAPATDQRQLQCFSRLKSLYSILFLDSEIPHNALFGDDWRRKKK